MIHHHVSILFRFFFVDLVQYQKDMIALVSVLFKKKQFSSLLFVILFLAQHYVF